MEQRGLYVFVEGDDDERFVLKVLSDLLQEKYLWIKTYKYCRNPQKDICAFIRAISNNGFADYIFLRDFDIASCLTERKEKTCNKYPALEPANLLIVKAEIESWYLAGLNDAALKELGMKEIETTENITTHLSTIFKRVYELFWCWYPLRKLTGGEKLLTSTA